jgi:Concanavalin A-like lectin/glucanases superfamily
MSKYFNRLPLWLCVLFALSVGVLSAVAAAPAAEPVPISAPRPSHWWPANGTARDRVGSDDGQLLNGVTFMSGFRGKAFHFNGQGSEVQFDAVGGNFDRDPFTLAFFIKTTSPLSQAIWEKRPVCNAASFWGFRMTGNLWGAELDGDEFGTDNTGVPGAPIIADGNWHHVALVRDGTNNTIYVDGANPSTAISPHPVQLSNTAPMRAGMSACTGVDGTNPYDGDLDELMIFDQALSQPQINAVIESLRGKH